MRITEPAGSPTFLKKTTSTSSSNNHSSIMMNPYGRSNRSDDEDDDDNNNTPRRGRFSLLKKQASVRFKGGDTSWQRNPSSRNLLVDAQKESYRDLLKIESEMNKSVSFANEVISRNSNHGRTNSKGRVSFAIDSGNGGGGGGGGLLGDGSSKNRGRRRSSKSKQRNQSLKLEDLDASWGGHLGCSSGDDDFSMSSSDEGSDDDSLGDLVPEMDASVNFRAKARQSMSFNMSFVNVGLEDDYSDPRGMDASSSRLGMSSSRIGGAGMNASSRRRPSKRTGRGSIFVIADERFGNSQVVRTRLEKSAIKLQRFFRRCLLVLRQFGDEFQYLKNEIQDTENRRVEELEAVAKYIEEEKEQFRMQLEEEYNANSMSPEEWEAYHKEKDDTTKEIERLKEENEQFKKDCKELHRTNNQLSIVDPEKEVERNRLEMEVQKLELDERDWKNIKDKYEMAVNEARRKLGLLEDNQRVKREHRKKMEFAIGRVIELLEESNQRDSNPSLVEKVEKLKTRREKKIKKLKAKTKAAMQGRIPSTAEADQQQQQKEEEDAKAEKQQRKARRKSSRKQKASTEGGSDLPELVEGGTASVEGEKQKTSKEKRRSTKKKKQLDDLPEMITVEGDGADNSQSQDGDDSDEKAATKKKKKKDKKDKDKDKKEKKKRTSTVEDEAFMKMYEAEARKKAAKKLEDSNSGGEPGALMALITG